MSFVVEIIPEFNKVRKGIADLKKDVANIVSGIGEGVAIKTAQKIGKLDAIQRLVDMKISALNRKSGPLNNEEVAQAQKLLRIHEKIVAVQKTRPASSFNEYMSRVYKKQSLYQTGQDHKPRFAGTYFRQKDIDEGTIGYAKVKAKMDAQAARNAAALDKETTAVKRNTTEKHRASETNRRYGDSFRNLRRNIMAAVGAYISFHAIRRGAGSFLNAAVDDEKENFRLTPYFGNKHNVVAAKHLAEKMGTTGTPFKQKDMIEAFRHMMESGIDPRKKKNFDTFGNIAGATGQDMTQVAQDIESAIQGNSNILRKYGFTNQQVFSLDRFTPKNPAARKNVILGMLEGDKRFKNGMRDFAASWAGMTNQMSNHWKAFQKDIMGSADDKNSLFSKIKGVYQDVLDWLQRNRQRIQRASQFIGEVFKWVLRQMRSFMKWVAGGIEGLLAKTDGTVERFRDRTMKFILFLELAKNRVVRFFNEWGWAIKTLLALWVGNKLVSIFTNGLGSIVGGLATVAGGATKAATAVSFLATALKGIVGAGAIIDGITHAGNKSLGATNTSPWWKDQMYKTGQQFAYGLNAIPGIGAPLANLFGVKEDSQAVGDHTIKMLEKTKKLEYKLSKGAFGRKSKPLPMLDLYSGFSPAVLALPEVQQGLADMANEKDPDKLVEMQRNHLRRIPDLERQAALEGKVNVGGFPSKKDVEANFGFPKGGLQAPNSEIHNHFYVNGKEVATAIVPIMSKEQQVQNKKGGGSNVVQRKK